MMAARKCALVMPQSPGCLVPRLTHSEIKTTGNARLTGVASGGSDAWRSQ